MSSVTLPDLTPDCTSCAALCCVAYPFEKGDGFAIDKDVGTPCPNLSKDDFRCTIHATLAKRGFGGCVSYDCAGAGQRVTQEFFEGENWRDVRLLRRDMTDALHLMRPVHEALLLLVEAKKTLPLPPSETAQCDRLISALCPTDANSMHRFTEPDVQDALEYVPIFLRSLSPFA